MHAHARHSTARAPRALGPHLLRARSALFWKGAGSASKWAPTKKRRRVDRGDCNGRAGGTGPLDAGWIRGCWGQRAERRAASSTSPNQSAHAHASIGRATRSRGQTGPGRRWAPRCQTSGRTHASINESLPLTWRRPCQRAQRAISTRASRRAPHGVPRRLSRARRCPADAELRCPPLSAERRAGPPRPIASSALRTHCPAHAS